MKRSIGLLALTLAAGLSGGAAAAGNDWMDRVGETLGKSGAVMPGGVYRIGLPRTELHVTADGVELEPGFALGGWLVFKKTDAQNAMVMGDLVLLDSEINFQPTGGGRAAINGDFVVTADEVNPVIKALRENGIEVTTLHSHMLDGQPRLFFVHFWVNDDTAKLAKGLRAGLDRMKNAKS